MSACKRIFIVGQPGAGKGLLAKSLSDQLGWNYVDADLGLEARIGQPIQTILAQGIDSFFQCQHEILKALCNQENIVVTTDVSIACSSQIMQLLSLEFTVFLSVSTAIQVQRVLRTEFLSPKTNRNDFFEHLHLERDGLFQKIARLEINSDDSALEKHIARIISEISHESNNFTKGNIEPKELIYFHRITHTPVQLALQQAKCLKYLAQGKSAKEIAQELHISYRTVEGTMAKLMELLGCTSSKELIALYHENP